MTYTIHAVAAVTFVQMMIPNCQDTWYVVQNLIDIHGGQSVYDNTLMSSDTAG